MITFFCRNYLFFCRECRDYMLFWGRPVGFYSEFCQKFWLKIWQLEPSFLDINSFLLQMSLILFWKSNQMFNWMLVVNNYVKTDLSVIPPRNCRRIGYRIWCRISVPIQKQILDCHTKERWETRNHWVMRWVFGILAKTVNLMQKHKRKVFNRF